MKYPIELEITDHCLLKCCCCPNKSYTDKGFMSFHHFKMVMDYLSHNLDSILFFDFCGVGDIFLHPEIETFLDYLSERFSNTDLKVLIPTKGNTVQEKHLDILERCHKNGLNFNLSVGIYSLREEIHDKISHVKNFRKIMQFLSKAKRRNLPLSLELVINEFSVHEVEHFYKFGDALGINYKIHNYHNFGGSIKGTGIGSKNSMKYKLKGSFADDETYHIDFFCKYAMPIISQDGYLYYCSHGGKQPSFRGEKIDELLNKYEEYPKLLEYAKERLNQEICSKCTYLNYNNSEK